MGVGCLSGWVGCLSGWVWVPTWKFVGGACLGGCLCLVWVGGYACLGG